MYIPVHASILPLGVGDICTKKYPHACMNSILRAYVACRHSIVSGIFISKWPCDIITVFSL